MKGKLTLKIIDSFILDDDLVSKKLADGGGLHLLVTRSGMYWRYNYRYEGKFKTLALGVYPDISLSNARKEHQAARAWIRQGTDPCAVRRTEKAERMALQQTERFITKTLNLKTVSVKEADYLRELETMGVGFFYNKTYEPYIDSFFMTADELIVFRLDPVFYLANKNGVNKQIYLAWMNADHSIQCSAFTRQGERCRHIVKHGVDAKTFAQMQDARCIQH